MSVQESTLISWQTASKSYSTREYINYLNWLTWRWRFETGSLTYSLDGLVMLIWLGLSQKNRMLMAPRQTGSTFGLSTLFMHTLKFNSTCFINFWALLRPLTCHLTMEKRNCWAVNRKARNRKILWLNPTHTTPPNTHTHGLTLEKKSSRVEWTQFQFCLLPVFIFSGSLIYSHYVYDIQAQIAEKFFVSARAQSPEPRTQIPGPRIQRRNAKKVTICCAPDAGAYFAVVQDSLRSVFGHSGESIWSSCLPI